MGTLFLRATRQSLFWKLTGAFFLLALLPLGLVELYVAWQVDNIRVMAESTSRLYERRAEKVAHDVVALLQTAEADLMQLATLAKTKEAFVDFASKKTRQVWVRVGEADKMGENKLQQMLYKEVAFVDPTGQEVLLVQDGVAADKLRNVALAQETSYRCEDYFHKAMALSPGQIYVSHLTGFHITKIDNLGVEKLLERIPNKDERALLVYRYLLHEMLRASGVIEYINSYREGERNKLVYGVVGTQQRITVEEPWMLSPEQAQAHGLELESFIQKLLPEDVIEAKRYDGVVRFAMRIDSANPQESGVAVLALDQIHLQQLTQHIKAMELDATVFAGYRDADFAYIFDDEGWFVAHPKVWNIRGVDQMGKTVEAYGPNTSAAELLVGRTPVSLMNMDWKLGDGYHKLVLDVRAKQSGMAMRNNNKGIPRTRIYYPIEYNRGEYARFGVFGGVMFGTRADKYIELMHKINTRIANYTAEVRRAIYIPVLVVMLLVVLAAMASAKNLVGPIRELAAAVKRVERGELDTHIPQRGADEIGELADAFSSMTRSLKRHIETLETRNKELADTQEQLLFAEREEREKLRREVEELQREVERSAFYDMVAVSPQMQQIQQEIVRIAKSSATVLILGENGTGKELVAQAIHRNSLRKDKPFYRVNCSAFNDNLLESELFGHVKGAFTGADAARKGLFEVADGGTLLLDEVGDMSLSMQKRLLRTLQEGELVPLGSNDVKKVDVRIIAATNQDLGTLIREGAFREDLFHRLNVIALQIPPLRERREDILPLAQIFMHKFADREKKTIIMIGEQAEKALLTHRWFGNVRELENTIARAVVRARSSVLSVEDLALQQAEHRQANPVLEEATAKHLSLEDMERLYILQILENNSGNKKTTATDLQIGYNALWRKLKKYQID